MMLASFLSASTRTFFREKKKESLAENIVSISLKHTTLSIVAQSPLLAHEIRLYSGELKDHLALALARLGFTTPFRLIIK